MKARLIKIEHAHPDFRAAVPELGAQKEPMIFIIKTDVDSVHIRGDAKFSDFINEDKIPKDAVLTRHKWIGRSGVVFFNKDTITVRILHPVGLKLMEIFFRTVIEVMRKEYQINVIKSPHRLDANDLVFEKDGKMKKFCGILNNPSIGFFGFFITLKFDGKKVKGLYKLNRDKFRVRGDIKEITDVVGGLSEMKTKLGPEVVDKIVSKLAENLGWELEDSQMTPEEVAKLDKILAVHASENWKLKARR